MCLRGKEREREREREKRIISWGRVQGREEASEGKENVLEVRGRKRETKSKDR